MSTHRHRRMRHARLWLIMLCIAITLTFAAGIGSVPSSTAYAANTNTAENSQPETSDPPVTLNIQKATAVVSSTSGYHTTVRISNNSDEQLPAGSIELLTSVFYTFNSRMDLQDWAQGSSRIPARDQLGTVETPSINPGASATVNIDVAPDNARLTAIATWGPKPLLVRFHADDDSGSKDENVDVHTFLTRSSDGLRTAGTPAMDLTVAMPMTSDSWTSDDSIITALTSTGIASTLDDFDSSAAVIPDHDEANRAQMFSKLIADHPALQVVADPTLLATLTTRPDVVGVMQPAGFDITQYASIANPKAYAAAGVSTTAWNATTAASLARPSNDQSADDDKVTAQQPAYAWQGSNRWTLAALTEARKQGYATVIADQHFDRSETSTVRTGKYEIATDAGEVTVLGAQSELSDLAQGTATDDQADAESSSAGRLSRFMAQSAFYQMEQPYVSRNLLVLMNANTPFADADALMAAIEQAPWLHLNSLHDMLDATATASGNEAKQLLTQDGSDQDSSSADSKARTALAALASDKADIDRFRSSILASDPGMSTTGNPSTSDATAQSRGAQSQDASSQGTSSEASPSEGNQPGGAQRWVAILSQVQSTQALHALGSSTAVRDRMVSASRALSSRLLDAISIIPSENITVLSETASMPVTIRNTLPYAVDVGISSLTDSMEIVTSRDANISVPADGEAQVTFTIRVATSASTVATLSLQDRDGTTFSTPEHTKITSSLQLSDKSGFLIVAIAVVLAVVGFYRQFTRSKDPDE